MADLVKIECSMNIILQHTVQGVKVVKDLSYKCHHLHRILKVQKVDLVVRKGKKQK